MITRLQWGGGRLKKDYVIYVWPLSYGSMWVSKYASVQVCKYKSMQVSKLASVQVCKTDWKLMQKYESMQDLKTGRGSIIDNNQL